MSEPARLVAVHQTGPRRIGIFDLEALSPQALLRLPKDARKLLGDLNDVAVSATGRLFVLSGKTGILAELELDGVQLELVRTYKVANNKNDVPEGITFDRQGRLWLVTDGEGHARQLELVADG